VLKDQLSRVPWPGDLDHSPTKPLFSSPTNIPSHSSSLNKHITTFTTFTTLHEVFHFFEVLQRAASHIKVTHPPWLFRLTPLENLNRSRTLLILIAR